MRCFEIERRVREFAVVKRAGNVGWALGGLWWFGRCFTTTPGFPLDWRSKMQRIVVLFGFAEDFESLLHHLVGRVGDGWEWM